MRSTESRGLASQAAVLLLISATIVGCTRHDDSTQGPVRQVEAVQFTEADIDVLRREVRKQTEHLKQIADDLELHAESGRAIDRELLLKIENQIDSARTRVQRIEAILQRVESGSR